MFFNPFDLIDPAADTPEALQRERRRTLTELELTGEWAGARIRLEKFQVIRVLDAVQEPSARAHYRLLLRHRALNDFLAYGDLDIFHQPDPHDPALRDEQFLHFLTPFFLEQYGKLLRTLLLQEEQEARLAEAMRMHDTRHAHALEAFDAAMRSELLASVLRCAWSVHPSRTHELYEGLHACCTQLHRHLEELEQALRDKRIFIYAPYEAFYVTHSELYIVRFAKKLHRLLRADKNLLMSVSVLAQIVRRQLASEAVRDRAEEALRHYAAFLDCFTTKLTEPGERDRAGEDYFFKMILRREPCVAEETNAAFSRLNVHLAYFFAWLAMDGPYRRELLDERERALLQELKARRILPSVFFETAGCSLLSNEEIEPKMQHFCDTYLGYAIKGAYNRATGAKLFDAFDRDESWEDYDKLAPLFQKRYEDELGVPPLVEAAHNSDVEKVKKLINAGDDIDATDHTGYTALMYASLEGHVELTKLLLAAGANIEHQNKHGNSPLLLAASFGHVEVVRLLLDAGANVHIRSAEGKTPLYESVRNEDYGEEVARMLIEAGANVRDCGPEPIICNCWHEVRIVPMLLGFGADINGVNAEGNTLLHIIADFCRNDSISIMDDIELLLKNGADPKLRNAEGKTAEDLVAEHGNPLTLELFRRK